MTQGYGCDFAADGGCPNVGEKTFARIEIFPSNLTQTEQQRFAQMVADQEAMYGHQFEEDYSPDPMVYHLCPPHAAQVVNAIGQGAPDEAEEGAPPEQPEEREGDE
jgi:hypothetical protein